MYERHFGFSSPLFTDGIARNERVFRTQAVAQLGRDLEIALTRKDSVAIVAGMSGTGKTTIAQDALRDISTRLAFTAINHAPLTPHELLEQLLTDFGFEPYRLSRVERLQQWRQFLSEMAATDTRVCLLVENAEDLTPEVCLSLHKLTAADATVSPGANVVLTTSQPPERLLTSEDMLAFNQRVRLRRSIDPLTEAETAAFLDFLCSNAGTNADEVFADDIASLLFELSGGVIRITENLIESALAAAAAADEPTLTSERLAEVAEQQFGMTRMQPAEIDELLDQATPEADEIFAGASDDEPTLTDLADEAENIPTLTDFVAVDDSTPGETSEPEQAEDFAGSAHR